MEFTRSSSTAEYKIPWLQPVSIEEAGGVRRMHAINRVRQDAIAQIKQIQNQLNQAEKDIETIFATIDALKKTDTLREIFPLLKKINFSNHDIDYIVSSTKQEEKKLQEDFYNKLLELNITAQQLESNTIQYREETECDCVPLIPNMESLKKLLEENSEK